jgi:hypothetical protein
VAGLFGGVPTPGSSIKELDHVAIGTSSQGKPVPIVYGTTRIAGNVIWMPKELWQKVAGQPAGKGGVDAGSQDTYYQGVAIAICEGPVTLGRVWRDKEVFATLADVETGTPFSFLSGTRSQSPWSFFGTGQIRVSQVQQTLSGTTVTLASTTTDVSTVQIRDVDSTWRPMVRVAPGSVVAGTYSVSGNVVTFDSGDGGLIVRISYVTNSVVSGWSVGYGGTAHVATSRLNLGNSNSLKNFSWEVNGFVGSGDVNPADVVYDFLTNTEYGCGWPTTDVEVDLGQDGTSASGYRRYCAQAGLLLSPAFEEQKNALEHVKWVLDASNSEILPTADGKIRIIPLGDTAVGTYTPNTTPAYSLNEDNFVCEIDGNGNPTTDPITVERRSQEDTYNCHPVEFLEKNPTTDATAAYTAVPYEDFDQGDVEASGGEVRKKEAVSLHCITNRNVAQVISRIRAQRDVYIRNKYTFRLGWQFGRIEPLDLLQISESTFGISNLVVRVTSVEEDEFGTLTITAEDWPFGVASAASYTTQTSEGGGQDHGADPLISNAPAIVVPPQEATADGVTPEVWIAASGGSKDWAGAEVWISWDNATFSYVSDVFPGTYGQLSNALAVGSPNDTTNTLRADLRASGGSLSSVTSAAKDALESLCWVDGELVSYQTASLVTTNVYDLTVLRRGVKGTVASSHPIGGKFVRLDDKVLRIPISADRFGSTLYVKLRAFNLSRTVVNDLATIPVYKTTLPSKGTVAPVVASSVRVSFDDFDLSDWDLIGNVQGSSLSLQNSTITGSKVLQAIGNVQLLHKALIPYDPNKTYKLLARYQQTALPSIAANIYFGFVGVQADGVTPVDETGTTGNFFSAHYLYAVTPAVDGWHTLQGYWKGRGSTNGSDGNGTTATAPAVAQATVKFVRLLMYLNNPSSGTAPADGTQQIDTLEFFDVNESSAYVGPPLVTAQIANDAVTAAKILDGEVGTNKIANLCGRERQARGQFRECREDAGELDPREAPRADGLREPLHEPERRRRRRERPDPGGMDRRAGVGE